MKKVAVHTGTSYDITIQNGILDEVGAYLRALTTEKHPDLRRDFRVPGAEPRNPYGLHRRARRRCCR